MVIVEAAVVGSPTWKVWFVADEMLGAALRHAFDGLMATPPIAVWSALPSFQVIVVVVVVALSVAPAPNSSAPFVVFVFHCWAAGARV